MIIQIDNVVNPEFYSKHAGKRFGFVLGRYICQSVSFATEAYAVKLITGVDFIIPPLILGLAVAAIIELFIALCGYGSILPLAEKFAGKKAYDVESDCSTIDDAMNKATQVLFVVCFLVGSALTVFGAFWGGRDLNAAGTAPNLVSITDSLRVVVLSENTDAAARATAYNQTISDISTKEALFVRNDSLASDWSIKWQNRKQTGVSWNTSAYEWQQKGKTQLLSSIDSLRKTSSTLLAQMAIDKQTIDRVTDDRANLIYSEALDSWKKDRRNANVSGTLALLFGILGQIGSFGCFFVVVMIDIGTGQVIRHEQGRFDRRNLLREWFDVHLDRFNISVEKRISALAQSPIKYQERQEQQLKDNQRWVDPHDPNEFKIIRLRPIPDAGRRRIGFFSKKASPPTPPKKEPSKMYEPPEKESKPSFEKVEPVEKIKATFPLEPSGYKPPEISPEIQKFADESVTRLAKAKVERDFSEKVSLEDSSSILKTKFPKFEEPSEVEEISEIIDISSEKTEISEKTPEGISEKPDPKISEKPESERAELPKKHSSEKREKRTPIFGKIRKPETLEKSISDTEYTFSEKSGVLKVQIGRKFYDKTELSKKISDYRRGSIKSAKESARIRNTERLKLFQKIHSEFSQRATELKKR